MKNILNNEIDRLSDLDLYLLKLAFNKLSGSLGAVVAFSPYLFLGIPALGILSLGVLPLDTLALVG